METYKSHPCFGCVYMGFASTYPCCNYIFMEDEKRPCPPGEGCTVKKLGSYRKSVVKRMAKADERRRKRKEAQLAVRESRMRTVFCCVCGTEFKTIVHNKKTCSEKCAKIRHNKQWMEYYERQKEKKNEDNA